MSIPWHGRLARDLKRQQVAKQLKPFLPDRFTGETPVPRGLGVLAQVPMATLLKKRKDKLL